MLKFKDFQNKIELDEALKSVNVIKELPVAVKAICDKYGIKFEPLNINQTTLDILGYSENYTDEFSDGKQDKIYNISNAMIESIKIIVHLIDDEFSLADNLTIKKIGGHSVGSCIVLADNYVLCGDECYYEKCLTDRICTGLPYNKEASEKFIVEYSKNKYVPLLFHDSKILQGRLGYSIIKN